MNIPNFLTILRIGLTIVFLKVIYFEGFNAKLFGLILFSAASITDYLDGYYAKKLNCVTNFGKIMDPIADKFLVLSAFFVFVQTGLMLGWMFAVIAIREIGITLIRFQAMAKGKVLAAERLGKIKTVSQICAIICTLIYMILESSGFFSSVPLSMIELLQGGIFALMCLAVLTTVVSGIAFIKNNSITQQTQ